MKSSYRTQQQHNQHQSRGFTWIPRKINMAMWHQWHFHIFKRFGRLKNCHNLGILWLWMDEDGGSLIIELKVEIFWLRKNVKTRAKAPLLLDFFLMLWISNPLEFTIELLLFKVLKSKKKKHQRKQWHINIFLIGHSITSNRWLSSGKSWIFSIIFGRNIIGESNRFPSFSKGSAYRVVEGK